MTPNADLVARYSDLLDGAVDARLLNVVGDLDALFAAVAPPRYLADRLEEAIVAHLANEPEGETRTSLRPVDALAPIAAGTPNGRRAPRRWQTLVATAAAFTVVALLALLLTSLGHGPGSGSETPDQRFARLGGLYIVAIADCPKQASNCRSPASLQRDVSIMHSRIMDRLGVPDSIIVRLQSEGTILVELPGVKDDVPVNALFEQGCVNVIATGGTEVPVGTDMRQNRVTYLPLVTCGSIDPPSVAARTDPQTGPPIVTFAFTGADRTSFSNYTSTHIGKYLTIALDGRAIESAVIESAITGAAEITGLPDLATAQTIATLMRYGPLPTPLAILDEQVVPPGRSQACSSSATPTPTSTAAGPTPPATPPATPPPTPTPGSGAKISIAASDAGCPTPTPPPTPTPGAQSTPTWTSTGEVIVPDVLGLPVAQALNELTAVNLRKVITINQQSTLPVGYVFKTDPPAGTSVPPSDPILVYVSTGAATATPTAAG
jgi:hypothetical protein